METALTTSQIAITGAADGIGLASARMLAKRGATLALGDISQAKLEAALASLGPGKHIATVVDVTNSKQVEEWIQEAATKLGKLDGAANIAGVCRHPAPITEESDENWDTTMGINAKGIFNCMRAQLKHMNDGGSIVNFASVGGLIGTPNFSVYNASKWAVVGLTKSVAREAGERSIRVNAICPGMTNTLLLIL
ncbi:hypothetical protein H2204_002203 [Knufia peltigerae]|uniref:Uncharacterized protein n=1 Tax=Knufia peltigerae TaxID=1002370 RepID=A0AA38YBV5_9EURO|nr:hypothetical protein H2204_002203 [Knufia peltigerae]